MTDLSRDGSEDIVRALVNVALPYWEAEGEIARRFFAGRPGREAHLFWLRAQIWKELNPVDGFFNGIHRELAKLTESFPRIERELDRHAFGFQLRQIVEEYEHYVLFADILEQVSGTKLDPAELVQIPEEKKLGDLRRGLVQSGSAIDKAAVLFTEGGGARLFREGAKVKGGDLEARIAHAMGVIYADERDHFREGARECAALIGSPADLARMQAGIVAVSRQRVAMRSEMFGHPVPPAELEAFIAGVADAVAKGEFVEP